MRSPLRVRSRKLRRTEQIWLLTYQIEPRTVIASGETLALGLFMLMVPFTVVFFGHISCDVSCKSDNRYVACLTIPADS